MVSSPLNVPSYGLAKLLKALNEAAFACLIMRRHFRASFTRNSVFASPQACNGLRLGIEVYTGLSVKGVGSAAGHTLLVPSERELK